MKSVIGVAMATATLTLIVLWPSNIDAVNDGQEFTAEIDVPKLVADGVEFRVTDRDNRDYGVDDEPALEIRAANTSRRPATRSVQVVMTSRSISSPLSRMAPVWKPIWQEQCSFSLNPGETKTMVVETAVKLPANSQINVLLQTPGGGEKPAISLTGEFPRAGSIVALSFSTAVQQNGRAALKIR